MVKPLLPLKGENIHGKGDAVVKTGSTRKVRPSVLRKTEECPSQTSTSSLACAKVESEVWTKGSGALGFSRRGRSKINSFIRCTKDLELVSVGALRMLWNRPLR